jgi:hypothetical protein
LCILRTSSPRGSSLYVSSLSASFAAPSRYVLSDWGRTTYTTVSLPTLLSSSTLPHPQGQTPSSPYQDRLWTLQHAAQRCLGHCRSPDPRVVESSEDSLLSHPSRQARLSPTARTGKDTLGPVVIWIATHPTTTTAENAHDASPDMLALLKAIGVEGAVVEWYEGAVEKLSGPHLLRVTNDTNPTHYYVHRFLTAALGVRRGRTLMLGVASHSSSTRTRTSVAPLTPRSSALATATFSARTPSSGTSSRALAHLPSTFD